MARRTKEEALATRHHLLNAAESVFSDKGVSRTSLEDIAHAAGVSRGAVYWHFKNKADLFNAIMERITLPMEDALYQIGSDRKLDPLDELRCSILDAMLKISSDERTHRVFEILTLKVEYIDELLPVKIRQIKNHADVLLQMQRCLMDACTRRGQKLPIPLSVASQGLQSLVVGLIDSWLLESEAFNLVNTADLVIRTYFAGLGLALDPASPRLRAELSLSIQ